MYSPSQYLWINNRPSTGLRLHQPPIVAMRKYFNDNDVVQIRVSIGIAPIGNNYSNIEFLMRDVDGARYRAKENGKGRIFYQDKVAPTER